jgi:hypothetical protein
VGGQICDAAGEFVCRGLVLQRSGTLFNTAFSSLPRSQRNRVSCLVCTDPCSRPVSGELKAGGPCCVAGWLCAACLDRSRQSALLRRHIFKCPLCQSQITATNLPFPSARVDQLLEMLTYDCTVAGCEAKGIGDAHALAKHLVDVHGPAEKALYEREVKLLHYDLVRAKLRKATTRGALNASLKIQADQSKRREEALLVKHAEQLSKQAARYEQLSKSKRREEALLVKHAERLSKQAARYEQLSKQAARYENLLQQNRKSESEAFARMTEMCNEIKARSRSPRSRLQVTS